MSRSADGILRVVIPLTPKEATTLRGADGPGDWVPGPIPVSIWKGTIMLGDRHEPPDKFIPTYTNQLQYVYREIGANYHLYVLDLTDSAAPLLYYVYFNMH